MPRRFQKLHLGGSLKSFTIHYLSTSLSFDSRAQWSRGLRRGSAVGRLLRLLVRITPGTLMCLSCECCVFSRRGLCDDLITPPEGSYRLWCVVVCDLETSRIRRPWTTWGHNTTGKENQHFSSIISDSNRVIESPI
jgi:hypothetical protein